jgi:hypothetical protein
MVIEIRLFVEGDRSLKDGLGAFFDTLRTKARKKRIKWNIVPCGSRDSAFDQFKTALGTYPEVFNLLLVDSEGPVTMSPLQHLQSRDRWDCKGIDNDRCHLMVQTMEAWFLADRDALKRFYKQGFHAQALPKRANVEDIDKPTLEKALANATRKTSQKKPYHKTHHAPKLLEGLDVVRVRAAAPHCERLFKTLEAFIESCP